mmetsp:Transcript_95423/g.291855  ORF Transcript_95423/g.291855 Transcript_95423/m.291855 type:complete len:216 (-) Transcript_95423:807-1454(-)
MSCSDVPRTCCLHATTSHSSVSSDRPFTVTKPTGRRKNLSRTPSSSHVRLSTKMLTPYRLQSCSRRDARFTLSPTRPYFMRKWLPMLPAKTWPQTRPMRALTVGRPFSSHRCRILLSICCCSMAAERAMTVCFRPWCQGVFHQAMISSPMNSPTMPRCFMMTLLIALRYSPKRDANTEGSKVSAMAVKLAMSLKKTVTLALATPNLACWPLCTRI